jgi:hypothetical protein
MQFIKERNKNYKYSKEIINKIYDKIKINVRSFNNNVLIGGTIDKTNKILNKYSDLNIEVDILDSTDQ